MKRHDQKRRLNKKIKLFDVSPLAENASRVSYLPKSPHRRSKCPFYDEAADEN
jgi:hypothetical protein